MYKVVEDRKTGELIAKRTIVVGEQGTFTLIRHYSVHKASHKKGIEFRRILGTLKDHNGITIPVVLLQYFFKTRNKT